MKAHLRFVDGQLVTREVECADFDDLNDNDDSGDSGSSGMGMEMGN